MSQPPIDSLPPPGPDAAATDVAAAMEMAEVVAAIFRMLDENIDAVLGARRSDAGAEPTHGVGLADHGPVVALVGAPPPHG